MGKAAKRAKQARREKRRGADGSDLEVPPMFRTEFRRIYRAWDAAVASGLMEEGAETKYHFTPDGKVLSVAVGKSGQLLANGERLTPSVAERLRREMPLMAQMVNLYVMNQFTGRGMQGAPQDGVTMLEPPKAPEPVPQVDEQALAEAQDATTKLVREGKVSQPAGVMVIPSPRRGVLLAVGGRDGELYVNGRALTGEWAQELSGELPELASDVTRLQALRAEWLDSPPEDRTLALADGCTDPNCHTPH